jgi:hypothetical protein
MRVITFPSAIRIEIGFPIASLAPTAALIWGRMRDFGDP